MPDKPNEPNPPAPEGLLKTGAGGCSDTATRRSKKYLVFRLSDNSYGVPLSDVREVIGLPQCVPIPSAPSYFLGLINLRGKVVSALDLKKKLGVSSQTNAVKRPAVIITECGGVTLGCVVDAISEVLAIEDSRIERSLEVEVQGKKEFIEGIARFSDRSMILLLDLKKAADVSELVRNKTLAQAG